MPEMILPGTYIEVRAEKLIAPGPIAIGNIGIVGTARQGRLADPNDPTTVYNPTNIGEAREFFGNSDPLVDPARPAGTREFTLIRALELAFANGAQRVFAVRVAAVGGVAATATVGPITFTALASGDGYNDYIFEVDDSGTANFVNLTITKGSKTESWRNVPNDGAKFVLVINGKDPNYSYGSLSSTGGKSLLFSAAGTGPVAPTALPPANPPKSAGGTGGAAAGATEYTSGLAALENQDVHIVVLAGQSSTVMATALKQHVTNTSGDLMRRERIGVIGSDPSNTTAALLAPGQVGQDEGRIVFVGPGIQMADSATPDSREVNLTGSYAAAAVAGLISSLDPHVSPTNKTIVADGLEKKFNGTELEQLVMGRVLALEEKLGSIRIVRGVTSSSNTAWAQITTRRIVDYARFGTRAAANPFIGKLNNDRVRQAMKGSINSLLADMVDREMLVSYSLDVSATREQEIRGIALVTMVLRPTFSIDYIRVVMYLE